MLLQLSAYGILWIIFPLVVFAAAREAGWRGAVFIHASITLLIVSLDLRWLAIHGIEPPQSYLGLSIAVALNALLVNIVLFPLSLIALALRHRRSRGAA